MHKYYIKLIILFLFLSGNIFSQKSSKEKNFSQKDFNNSKINNDVFSFWWSKGNEYRWFPEGDTLPYFVDDKGYKGMLNYGLEFEGIEGKNFSFSENFSIHKLNVKVDKFSFNVVDSIVNIEGSVSGGWSGVDFKGIDNRVNIFIGKKKDTTKILYSPYISNSRFKLTKNNQEVFNHIPLDTFPSFYLFKSKDFITSKGDERKFKIITKIDGNSILVFGLTSCFAEIFDIGKMVFFNSNKNINETKVEIHKPYPVFIINNNEYVFNKSRNLKQKKAIYYDIVDKAEDYILYGQFAKAKQQYEILLNENHYIFARDLHNAVRCSVLSRDYNKTVVWCKKLALKGIKLDYFEAKIFNTIRKVKIWQEFLIEYPNLNEKYRKGLNENLIKGIDELVNIDQKDYIKNANGEIEKSKLRETTAFVDKEFMRLIKSEGFPTEEKIGVQMASDIIISPSPKFFVIIIHSHQMKNNTLTEIKNIRENAIIDFEYDLRDNLDVFKKTGNTCLKIYKGNLYNSKTCITINEMQVRKIKYTFNNEHSFLIDKGAYVVIPFEKENEKDLESHIKERFNFVMKLTDDWFFYEK